jgi:hypothetical protein
VVLVVWVRFGGLALALLGLCSGMACDRGQSGEGKRPVVDTQETVERLQEHVRHLTVTIGERSVRIPENLERTAVYIESFYQGIDLPAHREPYPYRDFTVANISARLDFSGKSSKNYLIGAHYDSVSGTVGADDNASAVAVQLETARQLKTLQDKKKMELGLTLVSFALEEPPAYATRQMGSRIYAEKAKKNKEKIDGMLCLEMVGYTCRQPGCQDYPFPLMFMDYPKEGNFIGIVGNLGSMGLTNSLYEAFQRNPRLPVVKLTVPLGGWAMPSVRLSDHASFWDQGYKAVMITDTAFYRNPHYHSPSDTMDKLDFQFMAELVESLVIFFEQVGGEG